MRRAEGEQNVLSQGLKELVASGVVRRVELGQPASTHVHQPRERGRQLHKEPPGGVQVDPADNATPTCQPDLAGRPYSLSGLSSPAHAGPAAYETPDRAILRCLASRPASPRGRSGPARCG